MTKIDDKRVPALRFKGFNDDWAQRKLGDYGSVAMNKRIFKDQTNPNKGIPFYKIGTFGKKPDAYISEELFKSYKEKYPYPKKGDLLISASGSIGRIIEYTGQKAYYQDSNIVWLNHNDKITNHYLKAYYQIIHWDGIEGSTIKRLYNKNIIQTKISVPDLEEQIKLGNIISCMESLLSLQQRKLQQLKLLKKAMLQDLFAEQQIPKLRFSGFKENWAQRKLGDIANILRGASPRPIKDPKWFDENSNIGWIRISDVTSQHGRVRTLSQHISKKGQEKTRVVKPKSLLLSIAASIGYPVITYVETGVHDGFIIFNQPDFDLDFMFFKLQSIKKMWNKYGQPGSQVNINISIVSNTKISIPKVKEQEVISQLLNKIDQNLLLQQNQLNHLQKAKQFLLQNMFI